MFCSWQPEGELLSPEIATLRGLFGTTSWYAGITFAICSSAAWPISETCKLGYVSIVQKIRPQASLGHLVGSARVIKPIINRVISYCPYCPLRHIPYVLPYMDDLLPYIKLFARFPEAPSRGCLRGLVCLSVRQTNFLDIIWRLWSTVACFF